MLDVLVCRCPWNRFVNLEFTSSELEIPSISCPPAIWWGAMRKPILLVSSIRLFHCSSILHLPHACCCPCWTCLLTCDFTLSKLAICTISSPCHHMRCHEAFSFCTFLRLVLTSNTFTCVWWRLLLSLLCYVKILVIEAFALSVSLALFSPFWSILFLAHLLLDEWSVLTSFPMRHLPQAASVQDNWSLLMSSLCQFSFGMLHKNLVFQAPVPSVWLFPLWSTGVLAHILLHEWPVLTSFLQAASLQDGFFMCFLCQISLLCYVKFW